MSAPAAALGSSRNPPCPRGGLRQVPGVVPAFLAVGDAARSRFGNRELSCLPPAPFTAQTATWFMAAEGHCTGSINPVSQRFLPGKLAPVQSRQEGLAALCREEARTASSFPSLQARWILGYPLLSVGHDKRWHWERVSCQGKSPTAIAPPKIREICRHQGLCWLCKGRSGNSLGGI